MSRRDSVATGRVAAVLMLVLSSYACSRIVSQPGSSDEASSVVAIGNLFADAERILADHSARRVELAVAARRSAEGSDQQVNCYSLPDERAVCLVHQAIDGKDQVVDIEVFRDMDKPLSQRTTEKVRAIDIRRP
jgi:hypothetical protein